MTNYEKAIQYIQDVHSGNSSVGKWIRLVVKRHFDWLEGKDCPGYFDEGKARHVLNVFSFFRRTDGSGELIDQMPWQCAILYLAYGWRKPNGDRLTNTVYCEVARGNAKTEFLAQVGNYGFLFDGEQDAEIWWAATKKDQAKIGFDRQRSMLMQLCSESTDVAAMVKNYQYRINRTDGNLGCVGYLGKDKGGDDGLKPYYGLIDEFHAHPNSDAINILESGMVKRKNPMIWIITTQGYLPEGPNSQYLTVCKNILENKTPNPETLPFLFELDEGDNPEDRNVWHKPNPGMGVTVNESVLESRLAKAQIEGESKRLDFYVKNLNIPARNEKGWIKDDVWMACPADLSGIDLRGRMCIGGLDLALTSDFTSFAKFFPSRDSVEPHILVVENWLPEEKFQEYAVKYPVFRDWKNEGWIKTTPGNVTDYDYIEKEIRAASSDYDLKAVAYDKYKAVPLLISLADSGIEMVAWGQSIAVMSTPTQTFERMVMEKAINHGGNPLIRWMLGNVQIQIDANGNYKPLKDKSIDKIDGIVASINAVGYWLDSFGQKGGSALFNENVELISF